MRVHDEVSLEEVRKMIKNKFLGEITQMPPIKSRVKRQYRQREIKKFELFEKDDKNILFEVECQGGTYIRKLLHDLGEELEIGAHMLELRRMRAGIFEEDDKNYPVVNLYDFEKAVEEYKNGNEISLRNMLIPGEVVANLFPAIEIDKKAVKRIFHGSPIHEDELIYGKDLKYEIGEKFVAFSKSQFIGIFQVIKEGNLFARSEFTLQPLD